MRVHLALDCTKLILRKNMTPAHPSQGSLEILSQECTQLWKSKLLQWIQRALLAFIVFPRGKSTSSHGSWDLEVGYWKALSYIKDHHKHTSAAGENEGSLRVRSWDAHLKMLHSGSILRMVGSSTYSYCSSWCILALSTLTDTFTFSKPSSEAVVLQTMCLVDLLWAEASKCKPGSASSKSIVPITAQLKSSDLSLFPVRWRSLLFQEYAGNSVTRSAEEVTLPFHWFKQNHKSHLYSGLRI